jgi:PadR family transcriptional regulator AphA
VQPTSTTFVVLGMLKLGCRTGYEIKQLADTSARFFWAASYGQIYPELRRLEEAGLVTSEDDPQGDRRRRTLALTAAGEQFLSEWLHQPPHVLEYRDEGLLKLFFSDALLASERLDLLHAVRAQYEELGRRLTAIRPLAEAKHTRLGQEGPSLVLEFGIALSEWAVAWCEEQEGRLRGEAARRPAAS